MYIALSLNKNMSLVTYSENRKTKPSSTKTQSCLDVKRVNWEKKMHFKDFHCWEDARDILIYISLEIPAYYL